MALQRSKTGIVLAYPMRNNAAGFGLYSGTAPFSAMSSHAGTTLSAAGDVLHLIGHMNWADGATHTVARIWFRTGTVTNTNGVDLEVGFQNLATTYLPLRGTGTFTDSGTLNSPISSDTTYGVTLGTGTSVAHGARVCVSIDGLNDTTPDSIPIVGCTNDVAPHSPAITKNTTSSTTRVPALVFESNDGTPVYGMFFGTVWIESSDNTLAYNSADTYDEYGNEFTVPFKCQAIGAWVHASCNNASTSQALLKLYAGGTQQMSHDVSTLLMQTNTRRPGYVPFDTAYTFEPGTTYLLSIRSNSTGDVQSGIADAGTTVNGSGLHCAAMPGGTALRLAYRLNGGSWSFSQSQWMPFGIVIDQLDDGAGGTGSSGNRGLQLVY